MDCLVPSIANKLSADIIHIQVLVMWKLLSTVNLNIFSAVGPTRLLDSTTHM